MIDEWKNRVRPFTKQRATVYKTAHDRSNNSRELEKNVQSFTGNTPLHCLKNIEQY